MKADHSSTFARIDFPRDQTPQSDGRPADQRLSSPKQAVRRFLCGFLFVVFCAAAAWPLLPRRYESTASVILRPTDGQGRLDNVQSLRQPLDENAIQSEMDIISSPTIASTIIAQHHLQSDPEFAGDPNGLSRRTAEALYRTVPFISEWFGELNTASDAGLREQLQKHLTVSRDRRSYTVKMGYWSSNPQKSAALTETLLNAYLSNQLTRKRGSAEQNSTWLTEQQVEELRDKYEKSERAVREFNPELDLTADRQLAILKLESLNRAAATDKEQLDAAMMRLKEQEPQTSAVGPGVEIIAHPDPALRPSFPNALLFLVGTLAAAIAAGTALVWRPRTNIERFTTRQRV